MRPFTNESEWTSFYELKFKTVEDFIILKALLLPICAIVDPPVTEDYTYLNSIGAGSQATVDHYKRKPKRLKDGGRPSESYAVKRYSIKDEGSENERIQIFNEVNFIREMR